MLFALLVAAASTPALGQPPNSEPERDNLLSKVDPSPLLAGFQEQYNGFSGQLVLRFQTVNLPGKGGLDLVLQHYYSSDIWNRTDVTQKTHVASIDTTDHLGGAGWQLHMGKVIRPGGGGSSNPFNPANPRVVMPDGSTRLLFDSGLHAGELISEDRWRYKLIGQTTWELTATDGTVYEFTTLDNAGRQSKRNEPIAQCTRITDATGNEITITYAQLNPPFGPGGLIDEITDTWGRKVEFEYWPDSDRIRFLRVKNAGVTLQQWEFLFDETPQFTWNHAPHGSRSVWPLREVVPPEGESWRFDYYTTSTPISDGRYKLEKVTLPTGGTVTYTWDGELFQVGCQSGAPIQKPVLVQRQTGGRDVDAASWSYVYTDPGKDGAVTTISGPLATSEVQTFEGYDGYSLNDADLWSVGRLRQRVVSNPLQTVTEDYSWEQGDQLSSDYRLTSGWANCGSTRRWRGIWFVKPQEVVRTVERGPASYTTTQSGFDAYGNPTAIEESGDISRDSTLEYFYSVDRNILDGRVTLRELDPGTRERFWYNADGRLERRIVNPSTATQTNGIDTTFTYDPVTGDLTKQVTENASNDRETRYKLYAFGRPERDEIELGTIDTFVRRDIGPLGLVNWEEDGREGIAYRTEYSYDDLGRLTGIEPPKGHDTTVSHAADGSEVTVTRGPSSDRRRVEYAFDGFGRLRRWEDLERGDKRLLTYDALGRKTQEQFFRGGVAADTHLFDALGRLTEVVHPDATSIGYAYLGSQVTVTDERDHTTVLDYQAFGDPDERRLAEVRDAANSVWSYDYHPDWNLLTKIDAPAGHADRTFTYETRHFLKNETHPESGQTIYQNSPAGDRTQRSLGGDVLLYSYDRVGRLTRINHSPGSTHDVDVEYNKAGLRSELSNTAAVIEDAWDGVQRLTTRTITAGPLTDAEIEFDYDDHDRLESVTYPSGRVVEYKYNAKGQLRAVEDPGGSDYLTSVTYTPAGDLDVISYANGQATDYGYDNRFRPTSIDAGSRSLTLDYDDASNLTSWTGDGPARSFGYDELNRLTTATGPGGEAISYEYSRTGDREERTVDGVTSTYHYHPTKERLTSISGPDPISYSYDAAGRQTAAGARGYSYTPLGALEAITNPDRSFTYDGDGQRISRTDAQGTTYYVRDAQNRVLAEYDGAGDLVREHVYALGRRVATVLADGSRFYIQHDAQGSAWIVTDEKPQEAREPHRYWPFGSEQVTGGGGPGALTGGAGEGSGGGSRRSGDAGGDDGAGRPASPSDPGAPRSAFTRGATGRGAPTGELIFADGFETGCAFAWDVGKPSTCGDGLVFGGEECDLACLAGQSCQTRGFDGGTLDCTSDCKFDTSACHVCGNDVAEGPEVCDGTDLAGLTCENQGYEGGVPGCLDCAFDASGCHNCGNGELDPPEECDGDDFGDQTCAGRGFDDGILACNGCTIDDSGCWVCGDDMAEGPEPCDGTDLAGLTCENQGYEGGTPGCLDCAFDASGCHNCGNGVIDADEACDGQEFGGVTCQSLGYDDGNLTCISLCGEIDPSECFNYDSGTEPRFTGKELEEGLDLYYFGARYLGAGVGRFTTVDPGPLVLENPQTFNRYAYGLNGPYRFVDPDGRAVSPLLGPGSVNTQSLLDPSAFRGGGSSNADMIQLSAGQFAIRLEFPSEESSSADLKTAASLNSHVAGLAAWVVSGGVRLLQAGSRQLMQLGRSAASRATTGLIDDVTVVSHGSTVARGTVDLRGTLASISSGRLKPRNVFRNREGLLPQRPSGYYSEFVHPTPGVRGAGPQRIIRGQGGELFYTPDHYTSFIPLN